MFIAGISATLEILYLIFLSFVIFFDPIFNEDFPNLGSLAFSLQEWQKFPNILTSTKGLIVILILKKQQNASTKLQTEN